MKGQGQVEGEKKENHLLTSFWNNILAELSLWASFIAQIQKKPSPESSE